MDIGALFAVEPPDGVADPASRLSMPRLALAPSDEATDWRHYHGITPPQLTESEALAFGDWLLSFQKRPWDWVLACYPWGEPDSPLHDRQPERWQRQWLMDLQAELQRRDLTPDEVANRVIRFSVAAGHGVGKTSLVAWIIHWFVTVYPNGEAVITAGTRDQLDGKTWRELVKWQQLAINGWQMEWTATRYKHKDNPNTWFAEARAWSEANPQAMAGTHEKYVLIIFDEASAIAQIIWETVSGALTTGLCFFFAFGNPMEGEGGFWETHNGKEAAIWHRLRVDAREVSFANRAEIASWIRVHGAESDYCRTRIYGMFPLQAQTSFIDSKVVQLAAARVIQWRDIPRAIPRLMGVDIARQGGDLNAIVRRQGRKVAPDIQQWSERDTMATAHYIARAINEWRPDRVYIDGVGVGGGVVDYLRLCGYQQIIVDVQSGTTPTDKVDYVRYANMRAVMWARCREWLRTADLPPDQELLEELCMPRYKFQKKTEKELVESKDEMKARNVKSPNKADALVYTFWELMPSLASGTTYAEAGAV